MSLDSTHGERVTVESALPAGTNNIGDVDVASLPALPAGGNNIGDVDVLTLPAGTVAGAASLPAGTNNIGDVDVASLPAGSAAGATAKTADFDTGAGTDTVAMQGIALPASGGAAPGGTATNPVRTDPTGTTAQPVSAAALPLPTGAATEATLGTTNAELGATAETAPATDTATAGLNGRLQRVAQRLSTLIGLLPTTLSNGNLRVSVQETGVTQPVSGTFWQATQPTSTADGSDAAEGATTDAEATGNGSVIAILKRIRTLLGGTLTVGGTVGADTELPAARAAANAIATPTAPDVLATLMLHNGATLDMVKEAIAAGTSQANTGVLPAAWTVSDGANFFTMRLQAAVTDANTGSFFVPTGQMEYNGTNWDRRRGNQEVAAAALGFASAARTVSTNGTDQTNHNGAALHVYVNVTAIVSAPSITVTIQGKTPGGLYYALLTSAAITATGLTVLKVGRGIGALANGAAQDAIPRTWRVIVVHANANSITYDITAGLMV